MSPRLHAFSTFEHLLDELGSTTADGEDKGAAGLGPDILEQMAKLWDRDGYAAPAQLASRYLEEGTASLDDGTSGPVNASLSTDVDDIAQELGIMGATSVEALTAARRLFALRNHPDRARADERGIATLRMAIANALIDQAYQRLFSQLRHS